MAETSQNSSSELKENFGGVSNTINAGDAPGGRSARPNSMRLNDQYKYARLTGMM
jgi:hypothetical protein